MCEFAEEKVVLEQSLGVTDTSAKCANCHRPGKEDDIYQWQE